MSIQIRQLLSRVTLYRPDINAQLGEAQALFALYDAARKVARDTFILRQDVGYQHIVANTHYVDTKLLVTDATVLRVWDVFYNRIPMANPVYAGTWNPSTNTPSLSDASIPSAATYYLCSADGTTALGSETYWNKGDLLYSAGTSWKKWGKDKAVKLNERNKPTIEMQRPAPQDGRGDIREYSQENGVAFFYTPNQYDSVMSFNMAVVPSDMDIEDYDLPGEAEDVILAGAKAYILELPGEAHNMALSVQYKNEFKEGIGRLKAVGLLGWGAYAEYDQGNFTGRTR